MTVEPLGLVLKAGSWHLVAVTGDEQVVICLDELRTTRLTTQRFDVPESFSLSDFWAAHAPERPQRST